MSQLLLSFSGIEIRRVVDRAAGEVAAHAHDWPLLSVFVMGGYRNTTELGEIDIGWPSALFYGRGAPHANRAGADGFEQIEIEFDPAWLGADRLPKAPVTRWLSGSTAGAAKALAHLCLGSPAEPQLRDAILSFFAGADRHRVRPLPGWVLEAEALLRRSRHLSVQDVAQHLGRHPAWLGAAYTRHRGEGLPQMAGRLRVERAARALRESDDAPALIAAEAGFCDQSHMIRSFRRLLRRTPAAVRADQACLRQ